MIKVCLSIIYGGLQYEPLTRIMDSYNLLMKFHNAYLDDHIWYQNVSLHPINLHY